METNFSSADNSLLLVEEMQNDSLILCSGALKSTPINYLQHHCKEISVKIKFEQLCLYYGARLH